MAPFRWPTPLGLPAGIRWLLQVITNTPSLSPRGQAHLSCAEGKEKPPPAALSEQGEALVSGCPPRQPCKHHGQRVRAALTVPEHPCPLLAAAPSPPSKVVPLEGHPRASPWWSWGGTARGATSTAGRGAAGKGPGQRGLKAGEPRGGRRWEDREGKGDGGRMRMDGGDLRLEPPCAAQRDGCPGPAQSRRGALGLRQPSEAALPAGTAGAWASPPSQAGL